MSYRGRPSFQEIQKIDEYLADWKLKRVSVPADGNCFFHAVKEHLNRETDKILTSHEDLRAQTVIYLRKHDIIGPNQNEKWWNFTENGESREEYLDRLSLSGQWVDHISVQAMASALRRIIIVIMSHNGEFLHIHPVDPNPIGQITLGYVSECHFFCCEFEGESKIIESKKPDELRKLSIKLGGGGISAKSREGILKNSGTNHQKANGGVAYSVDSEHSNHSSDYEDIKEMESKEDKQFEYLLQTAKPESEDLSWDKFVSEPPEDESNNEGNVLHFFTKLAKYASCFFFLAAVFLGSLVTKITILVLANSYSLDPGEECRISSGSYSNTDYYRLHVLLMLMTALGFPEALTLIYSLYRIILKKEKEIDWRVFIWGLFPEIIHAVGLTFLVVRVLPLIDAWYASLMFSLVAFVPALFNLHAKVMSVIRNNQRGRSDPESLRRKLFLGFTVISLLLLPTGFGILFWKIYIKENVTWQLPVCTVLSLLMVSCRYWENFVSMDIEFGKFKLFRLHENQSKLDNFRFKSSFMYSFLRLGVMVGFCFLIYIVIDGHTVPKNFRPPHLKCIGIVTSLWYTLLTHIFCALGAFFFGRVACQTWVQRPSYSFPLIAVTPVLVGLTAAYTDQVKNGITLTDFFGISINSQLRHYIDWRYAWPLNHDTGTFAAIVIGCLALGWLALVMITPYLWYPRTERLAKTEVLFVKAIYGGPLINESLMLNLRQYQKEYEKNQKKRAIEMEKKEFERRSSRSSRSSLRRRSRRLTMANRRKLVPHVFLCATMWHETEAEMTQLLTSVMRLDKDQGLRQPSSKKDDDFYNFQVHVLFDDAMDYIQGIDGKPKAKPNKFVNRLLDVIPTAANKVDLGSSDKISPPVIYPTPYGGRLDFVLPYGNLMIVHLKDKSKIRHRKRWSQCMYMYYILGYLLKTKKTYRQEDIFLLALDGDVDFQPESMLLLLDRMRRNPDVGAACGRIHPIGSGPVVWFQKFEYAVGHWLQKTAEHVLGCVLCSPGCFSLFRGQALMDVNVVNRYTTKATEPLHYIQWDQGEDRWLCTLLLKRGWRIEFSAASDSYTFAPEEFKEFYNQRRRWGPSTMANVFDILKDAKCTVRNNDYISWGYIAYQMGLMASSILGPATVVLVVQGAFQYVFNWDPTVSLIFSLTPVIIFIILCYTTKPDFQIAVAGILTIIYALVMMAVLVGIIGQMATSLLDPSSIFMIAMVFIYAFTGIIHPTEIMCLLHGLLYYLCVPSAFILLMIYSLCNMNNVTWGTREVKKFNVDAQQQPVKEAPGAKTKEKKFQIGSSMSGPSSSPSCECGNLWKCFFCVHEQPAYQQLPQNEPKRRTTAYHRKTVTGGQRDIDALRRYSQVKSKLHTVKTKDELERTLTHAMTVEEVRQMHDHKEISDRVTVSELRRKSVHKRRESKKHSTVYAKQLSQELIDAEDNYSSSEESYVEEERFKDESEEKLYWIIEGSMEGGIIEYLDDEEREFWKHLIKKYLHPLEENLEQKKRIEAELKDLRNKMTGAYFLINSLWIVLTFALTLSIQDINITLYVNGNETMIQPLAFLFLIFYLVILFIQFVTMLIHRWSTFVHLLSVTTFNWNHSRGASKKYVSDPGNRQVKPPQNESSDPQVTELGETHFNQAYEDPDLAGVGINRNSNFSYKAKPEITVREDENEHMYAEVHYDSQKSRNLMSWRNKPTGISEALSFSQDIESEQSDKDDVSESGLFKEKQTETEISVDDVKFKPPHERNESVKKGVQFDTTSM